MGGNSSTLEGKRPVVVVLGAGLMGTRAVIELRKKAPRARIVVIDPKQYFENNIGVPRAMVDPTFFATMSKSHAYWLPGAVPYSGDAASTADVEFLVGRATDVNPADHTVTAERLALSIDGAATAPTAVRVPYDYLVIALGSRYDIFKAAEVTLADRTANMKAWNQKIERANHIVVVGGGTVGIDMAGEVQGKYAADVKNGRKRVTIVQRNATLVPNFPKDGQIKVTQLLKENGITVLTGQSLVVDATDEKGADAKAGDVPAKRTYTTTAGTRLEDVDLVVDCTGSKTNSEPLRRAFATVFDAKGRIKVKPTLQVDFAGAERVFALGDVASLPEEPLAFNAQKHIPVVVGNIASLIAGNAAETTYGGGGLTRPLGVAVSPQMFVIAMPCCCECLCTGGFFAGPKTQMIQTPPEVVPVSPAAQR